MKKYRRIIIVSVIMIIVLGLVMIASSSYVWAEYKFNNPLKYFYNQLVFIIIGFVLIYLISKLGYNFFYKRANILFIIGIILLMLVIVPGIGTVRNGSMSWFGIGGFGIQPSEYMKLALVLFMARYLTNNESKIKSIKAVLPILSITLVTFGLIMLQPDFGTGIVLVMITMGMFFIAGLKYSFFIKTGILGVLGITALIIVAPYRLERILSFLNPWKDPLGSGFQIIQSLYAIGPGGLFGFGLGNSRQKHFYLPEPQTDFIFSIIAEELGFIGAMLVITLFLLIIISSFKIAIKTTNLFAKYLAFGLSFWLAFQSILNLMVVVGLVPVTGVTLPFLSYGGSSLLVSMASVGIILNISKNGSV